MPGARDNGEVSILLVEDDPDDVQLTEIALRDAQVPNRLDVVEDGNQALQFLRREHPYERAHTPDLILLDLNLPRVDGREVLRTIKDDPDLRRIPVVVLTTSSDEIDIRDSYAAHANSFITKPVDFDEFLRAIQVIELYWLSVVKLPH
jgi:two-component system response regulator